MIDFAQLPGDGLFPISVKIRACRKPDTIVIEPGFTVYSGWKPDVTAYLRWRILARMRRFLRPIFRRPLPVLFVPILIIAPQCGVTAN